MWSHLSVEKNRVNFNLVPIKMADIFDRDNLLKIFHGKSVLFLGDSIMRNIYKDLVYLVSLQSNNTLIDRRHLCGKGEEEFYGDKLFEASEINAGRDYREGRDIHLPSHDVQFTFHFITRCFSPELEGLFRDYKGTFGCYPDLIVMNSALWDINRWGPNGIVKYRDNLLDLFECLRYYLPSRSQVVWMTTPPISVEIRGGFLIKGLEFQQKSMRYNVMAGNVYAATIASAYGFDVIDMHHLFLHQIHRRASDGIHWQPDAVRMQLNIIATHFCLSRNIRLPANWKVYDQTNRETTRNRPLEHAQDIVKNADMEIENLFHATLADLRETIHRRSNSYDDHGRDRKIAHARRRLH